MKETATIRNTTSDRKNAAKKIKKLKKISATAKLRVNMALNRAMFFFACARLMPQKWVPDVENKTGCEPINTGTGSYKIHSDAMRTSLHLSCLKPARAARDAHMQTSL